jgi:hypothetical protein
MPGQGAKNCQCGRHGFVEKDLIQNQLEGPGLKKIHEDAGKEGGIGE